MTDQDKRRALLRAIATTHLPLPIDVDIYEVGQGYHRDHAGIRLDDNQPGQVEQWADAFGAPKPTLGPEVKGQHRTFRSCRADVVLADWPVTVASYIDVPEAVES